MAESAISESRMAPGTSSSCAPGVSVVNERNEGWDAVVSGETTFES